MLQHRLWIPAPGSTAGPLDADPLPDSDFWITSRRRRFHNWTADDGSGRPDISFGGQELDPVTGHTTDGEVQIRVIDEPAPISTIACGMDSLINEGNVHLDDGLAFSSGMWTPHEVVSGLTAPGWFGLNAGGEVTVSGFVLLGSGTWDGYIEATLDGTEGGGAHWTPGQRVAFRVRVVWGLDTGPGNLFLETEGGVDPEDGETIHRVSFPDGSYDFWTIPADLAPNVYDNVASAIADANGEVIVRIGGEGYGGSCNLNATISDLEAVSCEDVETPGDPDELYITGSLADANARQQQGGRPLFLVESLDSGETWTRVIYAGYVKQITMERSKTFLFTGGDAGRGRRNSRAFSGLNPVENFSA
jgi:hypothetical protein